MWNRFLDLPSHLRTNFGSGYVWPSRLIVGWFGNASPDALPSSSCPRPWLRSAERMLSIDSVERRTALL